MDPVQIAWASGLFEGEGCIRRQLEIEMTDKESSTSSGTL